jgi:hypothetical protein
MDTQTPAAAVAAADTKAITGGDGGTAALPAAKPAAKRGGRDGRRARRHAGKGSTKVHCYGNALGLGRNIAAALLDVSETGARLLLKQVVAVGKEVEVNLEGQTGVSARHVARVVWVVPAEGGLFCVGCEFLKPVAYSALLGLARM